MDYLPAAVVAAWVLCWFAIVGLFAPVRALQAAEGRRPLVLHLGPALVWTWLTMAVLVPMAASLRAFNSLTALLIAGAWPAALWLLRTRSDRWRYQQIVRALVLRAVTVSTKERRRAGRSQAGAGIVLALPLLAFVPLLSGSYDVRLPVPADFDTLRRAQQLLSNTPVWDPVASLCAVFARLSSTDAFRVMGVVRLAVVALTAAVAFGLINELFGRRISAVLLSLALVLFAPWMPAATWSTALASLAGMTSLVLWARHRSAGDRRHAVAALLLAGGQVCAFAQNPDVLIRGSRTAHFLEHRSSAQEVVRLAQRLPEGDWTVVGSPELQLESGGNGQSYDLARFVSRYHTRAGDPQFRFDIRTPRLYVFVEKQPFDAAYTPPGVEFVTAQAAEHRVPHARMRLHRLAREICDDYRRTHAGVTISYEDGVLRVYEIAL